jgi:hypothetical protein
MNYPFASLLSLAQQQYDSTPIHSSPTIKDYAYNRRQRERTTFDPHEETPRLIQIFTDTKHPTRYQIASICENLNALPCRKGMISIFTQKKILFCFVGKKALEPYNIQYWFKNARAALKRKKRRFINSETPTQQQQQQQEEYNSPLPHEITNHDEPNHSSIKCELDSSDEIEDDEEDEIDLEEKQKQQNHNNYYFNYLQAFDISLTDQQRQKTSQSDESNDEDNMSSISEQTPPTQILPNTMKTSNTTTSFDYNRSRRNRIFIDPTSEVPKLEQWFAIETHPDHVLIERICSELNEGEYRTKFPKLESKHIRLWFKNHRAKVKRICRIQIPNTTIETTEKNLHNVQ